MAHVEIIAWRRNLPELYANVCLMAESFFHRQGFYTVKRGNCFFNGLRIADMHVRKRLFLCGVLRAESFFPAFSCCRLLSLQDFVAVICFASKRMLFFSAFRCRFAA